MNAAVGGVTPAALSEIGGHVVELPPADRHVVEICRINRDYALVRSIADNVLPIGIDVCLITREHAELRDHSWRRFDLSRRRGRIIIFFDVLSERHSAHGRQLG